MALKTEVANLIGRFKLHAHQQGHTIGQVFASGV